MDLIDYCRDHSIDQILALPDVAERVKLYNEHAPQAIEQIKRCVQVHRNLIVLDLRAEETIWATNRFTVYGLYPDANISIHILWGPDKTKTVFATGKSIVKRSSKTNIGELMLKYGGGGHENAGTCQVENPESEEVLGELIKKINADG
jgi:nanoRNase/pAp phosphatase (c-di-AMP/oligoRNAs hydrolase)